MSKDEDGTVHSFEIDQLDELAPFMELEGEAGGILIEEDVEHAAEALEPNSSAVLLIWEDLWAAPFADALYNSGGVVLEGGRIPRDVIEAATAAAHRLRQNRRQSMFLRPRPVARVARTAVVAGTATAVSDRVSRRQANRRRDSSKQEAQAQAAARKRHSRRAARPRRRDSDIEQLAAARGSCTNKGS